MTRRPILWTIAASFLCAATAFADDAAPPSAPPAGAAPSSTPPAGAAPAGATDSAKAPALSAGKVFASREEAARALFDAMEKDDDAALREILGPGNDDLAQDGRDEAVRAQRALMAKTAAAKLSFRDADGGAAFVLVGEKEYPLAIPLRKDADGFRFDAAAGRRELLARRIGEHELEALAISLAYADAQREYASKDRDGDGVLEFARRLSSTPGTHDGLWWSAREGEEQSPAGTELAALKDAPDDPGAKEPPFDGYYWRILEAQGANAPGGARSWLVGENLTAGFGLVAVPAVHRNTGIQSFLVGPDGRVFEKDLGPDGLRLGREITTFDPDSSWHEVDEATRTAALGVVPSDAPFTETPAAAAVPTGATAPASEPGQAPAPMQGSTAGAPPAPPPATLPPPERRVPSGSPCGR